MEKSITCIIISFMCLVSTGKGFAQSFSPEDSVRIFHAGEQKENPALDSLYRYDSHLGQFQYFPQSPTGIDSLLVIGKDLVDSDPEKAAHAVFQALELAEIIRYHSGIGRSYELLGSIYHILGDPGYALEQFYHALEKEMEREDPERIARVMNHIARVHIDQNDYEQATGLYIQAINELSNAESDVVPELTAVIYSNLGQAFFLMAEIERSQEYYQRAFEAAEGKPELEHIRTKVLANIGYSLKLLGDYEGAGERLREALNSPGMRNDATLQSEVYLFMAELNYSLQNYDEAVYYSHRSLNLAEENQELTGIKEASRLLSEIHEARGNLDQSLFYHKKYFTANEALQDTERQNRINQRQIRFDLDHRNREIALLNEKAQLQESELANQELWRRFLLTSLILSVIILGLLIRNIHLKKRASGRQQKQKDEIERQNGELIQLNIEKDEFIGMAAHDLRNPLANINGVVYLMERTWVDKDEETREYIQILRDSINKMVDLINNYLNINALEQGLKDYRILPMDIREPLEQVVENFKKPAEEKEVLLTTEYENNLDPVLSDVNYFIRIFENLVSNAIKFSPSGSRVKITAKEINNHMEISVIDNGPGITEEDQKKMFKRFSRLSNKPTGGESSTGLGLFIVKKLTEAMDGTVQFTSKSGSGTTFTVILPIDKSGNKSLQPAEQETDPTLDHS